MLGISQTTLATAVGITFQQIQKYERGSNRISFSRLVEIARTLDCRVADLIGDLDGERPLSPQFQAQTAHLGVEGAPQLLAAYAATPRIFQKAVLSLIRKVADQETREDQASAA